MSTKEEVDSWNLSGALLSDLIFQDMRLDHLCAIHGTCR